MRNRSPGRNVFMQLNTYGTSLRGAPGKWEDKAISLPNIYTFISGVRTAAESPEETKGHAVPSGKSLTPRKDRSLRRKIFKSLTPITRLDELD